MIMIILMVGCPLGLAQPAGVEENIVGPVPGPGVKQRTPLQAAGHVRAGHQLFEL